MTYRSIIGGAVLAVTIAACTPAAAAAPQPANAAPPADVPAAAPAAKTAVQSQPDADVRIEAGPGK